MRGTVVLVKRKEGFGFIETPGQTRDTFFHRSKLTGLDFDESLVGEEVEFELDEDPSGRWRAIGVRAAR